MGTSLVRNRHPVGPYSRTMQRLLWWCLGGVAFFYERGNPVGTYIASRKRRCSTGLHFRRNLHSNPAHCTLYPLNLDPLGTLLRGGAYRIRYVHPRSGIASNKHTHVRSVHYFEEERAMLQAWRDFVREARAVRSAFVGQGATLS